MTLGYDQLRDQSASVVTPLNVKSLDDEVISKISEMRGASDVILDSHAVTRESYGFRAIPFSLEQLGRLALDGVIVLRCDKEILLKRMEMDRQGRRYVSAELAHEHQLLQESVGIAYAINCGCPIFILDTTTLTQNEVFAEAYRILLGLGASAEGLPQSPGS